MLRQGGREGGRTGTSRQTPTGDSVEATGGGRQATDHHAHDARDGVHRRRDRNSASPVRACITAQRRISTAQWVGGGRWDGVLSSHRVIIRLLPPA
jgi:hypothetical protein